MYIYVRHKHLNIMRFSPGWDWEPDAIVIQLITGLLGYGCLMVAVRIAQYNIWWFLSAGIYGICDSYGNTIINSILGSQFHLKIEPFAVFRFVLAISSGAFSFITP